MLKQEQILQSLESLALDNMEMLGHILIPACALGPEILRQFRVANPNWRPRILTENSSRDDTHQTKSCSSCQKVFTGKAAILESSNGHISSGKLPIPQTPNGNVSSVMAEGTVLSEMKVVAAQPVSMSFGKAHETLVSRGEIVVPLIQHSQVPQGKSMESNVNISKVSHLRSMKATSRVEAPDPSMVMMKVSLPRRQKPPPPPPLSQPLPEMEARIITSDSSAHTIKPNTRGDLYGRLNPQHIMKLPGMSDSGRVKGSELALLPAITPDGLLHDTGTSSEEASEDTMARSQMHTMHVNTLPHTGVEALGMVRTSKSYVTRTSLKVDDPILVDDNALFDYIVATRNIPNGESLSTLGEPMQKNLLRHYKSYRPPCPHCNSSMHVKFRYFNNSSKSSLLQPRYTCRNPDTCLTVQEKTGKAGSRDFTLPKPKDIDNHGEGPKVSPEVSPTFLASQSGNHEMQVKTPRQPQMIARIGSKRPVHGLDTPSKEAFERRAKLPNTTLSLQSLNGSTVGVDPSSSNNQLIRIADVSGGNDNMRIVELPKSRALLTHAPKAIEDSNSSSSTTQTASDEQLGIDVKCQAASSEIGRLIVQPISVQTVTPVETGSTERSKGKITEVNIRMFIDLSNTSPC